jgi:predicted alpha/beta-fold hydrolase
LPLVESTYSPAFFLKNAHLATIIPNKLRRIEGVTYTRERLELPDNDFVDIDYSKCVSKTILIFLHGLEGNSSRAYAKSVVKQANAIGWDACVMNQRGCSGEPNRLYSSYHSGKSEDLRFFVNSLIQKQNYDTIYLAGVSLGGNIILKYLGEEGLSLNSKIKGAFCVSVPLDLESSAVELAKPKNFVYMKRFLKTLKSKTIEKASKFPSKTSINEILQCRNFLDFDNLYTAPAHGFKNAEHYWKVNSSKPLLANITCPVKILSAKNDTFLGENCYPIQEAKNNSNLFLEVSKHGGHVGFMENWSLKEAQYFDRLIIQFLDSCI